jgi:hypothetical protein
MDWLHGHTVDTRIDDDLIIFLYGAACCRELSDIRSWMLESFNNDETALEN